MRRQPPCRYSSTLFLFCSALSFLTTAYQRCGSGSVYPLGSCLPSIRCSWFRLRSHRMGCCKTCSHSSFTRTNSLRPKMSGKSSFSIIFPLGFTANTPNDILAEYYEGDSTLYKAKHLKAWVRPILVWTVFTLVLLYMLHCMNTLVRRQWVQTERLAFPIIQLPVAMVQSSRFLRNGFLWLGFAIPAVLRSHERVARPFPIRSISPP